MFQIFKKKKEIINNKLLEIKYDISSGIPFKWEYEIKNPEICEFVESKSKGEKTKEPICGGNVEISYYFKGLKKGKTKILFNLINFADRYLSKTDEYTVEIDEKLNINIVVKEERS